MGAQDIDFLRRIEKLTWHGAKRVREAPFSQAIPNTVKEKITHVDPKTAPKGKWGDMDNYNRTIFNYKRKQGQLVRNLHKEARGENLGVPCYRVHVDLSLTPVNLIGGVMPSAYAAAPPLSPVSVGNATAATDSACAAAPSFTSA